MFFRALAAGPLSCIFGFGKKHAAKHVCPTSSSHGGKSNEKPLSLGDFPKALHSKGPKASFLFPKKIEICTL